MTALFDERQLGEFIDAHYKASGDHLFRMEQLPRYDVPHQTAELERWLAGAVEPNWETKQPWLDSLASTRRRSTATMPVSSWRGWRGSTSSHQGLAVAIEDRPTTTC